MPEWLQTAIFAITLVVMLVGLFGLMVPVFPGMLVIWLAALGFGIVVGFNTLGIWMFALITGLAVAGSVLDNVFMAAGARQGGSLDNPFLRDCGRRGGDDLVPAGGWFDPGTPGDLFIGMA